MKKLFSYMKYYKKNMILGPFFKWLEAFFELLVPLVVAHMIDQGIAFQNTDIILQDGILLFVLSVVGIISSLTAQFFASRASQGIGTRIRDDLFAHIMSFSYQEIDEIGTSTLITRINNDVNQIQIAVAMMIRLVVRAPFLVVGASVMAFLIDAKLSIIFFITIPILIVVMYFIMHKSIPLYQKIQKMLDHTSLITKENLEGVRVIRAFSKEKKEEQRFNDTSEDVLYNAIKVSKLSSLLSPLTYTIVNIAIIAILWVGGIQINIGNLTQGEIIAFVNYMNQIILALFVVANLVIIFTKASVSLKRILQIFAMHNTQTDGTTVFNHNSDTIFKVDNVSFAYGNNEEMTLEHISFTIQKHQSIGIIGGTGSGKTTLINLLARLYDHSEGMITYYDRPLTEYKIADLRKEIGIVVQKANLFSATIRENLKMGNAKVSDEEIWEALKIAQAYAFVDALENKLDTHMNRGGTNFSGGQKQRLCIARTILQKPRILILDDASSALDYQTDAALRKALHHIQNLDAVIYVSQRISSLMNCDNILVLDDGKAVGFDTHENLLKNCPIYYEIYASQNKEENSHE